MRLVRLLSKQISGGPESSSEDDGGATFEVTPSEDGAGVPNQKKAFLDAVFASAAGPAGTINQDQLQSLLQDDMISNMSASPGVVFPHLICQTACPWTMSYRVLKCRARCLFDYLSFFRRSGEFGRALSGTVAEHVAELVMAELTDRYRIRFCAATP